MNKLINITIPVFNEEQVLEKTIAQITSFACSFCQYEVVIANNGSTDRTLEIARALACKHQNVTVLDLNQRGRGGALKTAWLQSTADILTYMDADLSSDLKALPRLVGPLMERRFDLAIGSRLWDPKLTTRCFKRELASRVYNFLHSALLQTHFLDAQCGFKAMTREAARHLLPLVQDTNWFFDTELLVLAERHGYRILELPIRWIENRQTHVKLVPTVVQDLAGLFRLWRTLRHQSPSPRSAPAVASAARLLPRDLGRANRGGHSAALTR